MIKVPIVHKLQEVRAVHALADICNVSILRGEVYKFAPLAERFGMKYQIEASGIDVRSIISIDHAKPETCIYDINKPLIYPMSICTHLRQQWPDPSNRSYEYSFMGLMTPSRQHVVYKWINENNDVNSCIMASDAGRKFPVKSWHAQYYDMLLNSKFTLCPSGDFIWTYRFFEAILCGSIPIVQTHTACYDGFRYFTLNDGINDMQYDLDTAVYNYNLCVHRLTLSNDERQYVIKKCKAG